MIVRVTKTAACHRCLVCGETGSTEDMLLAVNGLSRSSVSEKIEMRNTPNSSLTHMYIPVTLQGMIYNCLCKNITQCSPVISNTAALQTATN